MNSWNAFELNCWLWIDWNWVVIRELLEGVRACKYGTRDRKRQRVIVHSEATTHNFNNIEDRQVLQCPTDNREHLRWNWKANKQTFPKKDLHCSLLCYRTSILWIGTVGCILVGITLWRSHVIPILDHQRTRSILLCHEHIVTVKLVQNTEPPEMVWIALILKHL